jgi:hypothetical protein
MLFSPTPTPGSSGGPIVDEESGAVVGIILGSQMDNRIESVTGCGVPGEIVFEVICRIFSFWLTTWLNNFFFSLPG